MSTPTGFRHSSVSKIRNSVKLVNHAATRELRRRLTDWYNTHKVRNGLGKYYAEFKEPLKATPYDEHTGDGRFTALGWDRVDGLYLAQTRGGSTIVQVLRGDLDTMLRLAKHLKL